MTPERWQKVEELCNAALEHEASQRETFLSQACQGDDELRREVESLLEQETGAQSFLEEPVREAPFSKEQGPLIGRQMGSYRIVSLLGSGGMGDVYQAHDTKLGREVAVKVIPPAFLRDPDRLGRFQREARMLAALNHPNIATIHGLEECGGVHYLVMELVPGKTLAERLKAGPMEVAEALQLATQIAEALEAAHEKGVIHRDLKPANVKVTPEGRVKVLDFGLAKALASEISPDISRAATRTAVTEEGRILGTPTYMSPEQARGKAVDRRTDIWAFGCVLYELLSGRRAFDGDTLSDTLAALLQSEPEWKALPENTPDQVRDLLRRCLQKETQRRFRDAADIRIEIEEAVAALGGGADTGTSKPSSLLGWRSAATLAAGTLLLGIVLASLLVWNLKPVPSGALSRSVITLPAGQELAGFDYGPVLALSPDGSRLAYIARQQGTQQLCLRSIGELEARSLPNTEGAVAPFFSPDSQWVGFFARGKLKKISVNGGAPQDIADAANPRGGSWSSRGTIVFAPTGTSVLEQVSDAGGAPQSLTQLEQGEVAHRWPEFLPDGNTVLFTAGTSFPSWVGARIALHSIGGRKRQNLILGGMNPHYGASGQLIYAQGGKLMAVPFDLKRQRLSGTAVPVVEGVLQSTFSGVAQYSLAANGTLIYVPGNVQALRSNLVWVTRNGMEQPVAAPPRSYRNLRLSPDGRQLAVEVMESEDQIWLYDFVRETLTPLTTEASQNGTPVWTPDGKRVVFYSNRSGSLENLFWTRADGSGGLERLTSSGYTHVPTSLSPDGQLLAFFEINPVTSADIWILRVRDRQIQPFLRTPFNESAPQFSPDGRWVAYVSDESGRNDVYIQAYPGPGQKWQISTEGGTEPVWNRDGRELFYRSGDKMMAVEIAARPAFAAGKPRVLFERHYVSVPGWWAPPYYDVAPDGQRFLMLKPIEQTSSSALTQIVMVQNWFEELKQKVPTGKK